MNIMDATAAAATKPISSRKPMVVQRAGGYAVKTRFWVVDEVTVTCWVAVVLIMVSQ